MQIKQSAAAGNRVSGDVFVTIDPSSSDRLDIDIESSVMAPFGDAIRNTVQEILADFSITAARVKIVDKGALDWVIRARMQTAVCRAAGSEFNWEGEDL